MSITIDSATKLHERQVAAVDTIQSNVVKALDVITSARSKAPQAPAKLADAVDKITAPLTKVVGTPDEVQAYAVASTRDWLKVQHQFQTALLDAVFPSGVTVEVPAPSTPKKKS